MEYLVGTPKPVPSKKRWGRKQKVDQLIRREARRIVERYLSRYGQQTSLPLWGEPEGRPSGSPEHSIGDGDEAG